MDKTNNKKEIVALIGASHKPDRYSHRAFKMLQEYGYKVFLINPVLKEIEGTEVYSSLSLLKDQHITTITLYVNPQVLKKYVADIIKIKPLRVIFNPGTESDEIEQELQRNRIVTVRACTLVMLRTGQF